MQSIFHQSEEFAFLAADHISAMLAYWDKNLICRFANVAYLDWFDQRREDMVDKMTIKELLGPLYEKNLPYIQGALNGEVQTFEREIPIPNTAGVRYSLANYYPHRIDGEVKGFFVHVADVTPLKVLEKELVTANQIIAKKNERLQNFSHITSHNIASYAHNLRLIIERYTAADSKIEQEATINLLERLSAAFSSAVAQLNETVNTQQYADIPLEAVDIRACIERVISGLQIQLNMNQAIINNSVSSDVCAWANPVYMESIVLNLFTNAIKYKDPNRAPIITVSAVPGPDIIELSVHDNGQGINLDKYGAELFGLHKTFHDNVDAQGIGLFITKYQVEAMGGKISVESEEGVGTTFTVSLPTASL